jgi:hypothetical protein
MTTSDHFAPLRHSARLPPDSPRDRRIWAYFNRLLGLDGRVVCAWESVLLSRSGGNRKMIATSIEDLNNDEQPGIGKDATGLHKNICTPSLAISPKGEVSLIWADSDSPGRWTLMHTQWNTGKKSWNKPKAFFSEGNPRFPSAAYAKDGVLWVAYCVDKDDRREVAVTKIEKND